MSDTKVYERSIRARLGTAANVCEVVLLRLITVPIGAVLSCRILQWNSGGDRLRSDSQAFVPSLGSDQVVSDAGGVADDAGLIHPQPILIQHNHQCDQRHALPVRVRDEME